MWNWISYVIFFSHNDRLLMKCEDRLECSKTCTVLGYKIWINQQENYIKILKWLFRVWVQNYQTSHPQLSTWVVIWLSVMLIQLRHSITFLLFTCLLLQLVMRSSSDADTINNSLKCNLHHLRSIVAASIQKQEEVQNCTHEPLHIFFAFVHLKFFTRGFGIALHFLIRITSDLISHRNPFPKAFRASRRLWMCTFQMWDWWKKIQNL